MMLATAYAQRGDMKKANKLMGPNASPSATSQFYLRAAAAAIDELEKKKTSGKNLKLK
jgi:hypothetical protein